MDAELRDGMVMSTLTVRRPSAISRSGATETLGAAVTFDAYGEVRDVFMGIGDTGAQRVTQHLFIVDALDVVASALVDLKDTDRFWIEGSDPSNAAFGKKPKLAAFKDPDTQEISHYEVRL